MEQGVVFHVKPRPPRCRARPSGWARFRVEHRSAGRFGIVRVSRFHVEHCAGAVCCGAASGALGPAIGDGVR